LVRHAQAWGYTSLALTDRDNLCGLWPFLQACEATGVVPIVGAEVTEDGPAASRRRALCLVENDDGYRSLCRLISARHRGGFSLREAVERHRLGLVVLTDHADDLLAWHESGVTVSAGLGRKPEQKNHEVRRLSRRLGVPQVAWVDNGGRVAEDHDLHRVLRAIAQNTEFSRLDPAEVFPADAFFAPPKEFERRFAACPEALAGTAMVAERCTFRRPNHGLVLPPYTAGLDGAKAVLREEAYAGARRRYGNDLSETVVERLDYELLRIEEKGFSSYFLVVRDIVRRSPRICGRGSGAASLVAYCLGITNVCPIRYNLYFERFLNPARQDPPDIDVDFAWDERDAVIDQVLKEHGTHAAMVSSHVLFQPRMAIREVAKVFGLTDGEIGRVVGKLPWFWQNDGDADTLLDRLSKMPELKAQEFPDPWPAILRLAESLIGIPRHISVHPGGTIITPGPIEDYAPVETAPKGVPILQWDKDGAEDGGLVKIDLLGNRSLAVIRDALVNLRQNGAQLDEFTWIPEKDPATMRAVALGLTMGCFYIESPAMRLLQQKAGVGDFEHLVIHSSIIRPAANTYIREYLRRLKGGAWKPIHPLLTDVLDETFGIMVYQEDVSKTAVALAGFSHSDADALRKILSKRDRVDRLRDWRQRFVAGAQAHGVTDHVIEEVWAMMMSFDGYSFCKPHSASYARVSFQAAYLKVHFPAEMMAAVITNQGGFYSTFAYVSEARRMGLTVVPPSVNTSQVSWRGCGQRLAVGLQTVLGLSGESAQRIVFARRDAPYTSFGDFMHRARPDSEEARALILAGACDSLMGVSDDDSLENQGKARARLLWDLARTRQNKLATTKGKMVTGDLFSQRPVEVTPPPLPSGDPQKILERQYEVLGFLCDRHPMQLFATVLASRTRVHIAEVRKHLGHRICIAGWLVTGKVVHTKHGEPMEFLTFEDESGILETTFFPAAYHRLCDRLDQTRPFWLWGRLDEEYGAITLTVDEARPVR
jgi:DNA polymerase-3 subunit alpha/error-prone DNA polymerase